MVSYSVVTTGAAAAPVRKAMPLSTLMPPRTLLALLLASSAAGEQWNNPDCTNSFVDFKPKRPCAASHVVLGGGSWCAEVCWPPTSEAIGGMASGACAAAGFSAEDSKCGAGTGVEGAAVLDWRRVRAFVKVPGAVAQSAPTTIAIVARNNWAHCVEVRVTAAAAQLALHLLAPLVSEGSCAGVAAVPCEYPPAKAGGQQHTPYDGKDGPGGMRGIG